MLAAVVALVCFSCKKHTNDPAPPPPEKENPYTDSPTVVTEQWMPYMNAKPQYWFDCTGLVYTGTMHDPNTGLRDYLLGQSLAGLAHKAVKEGRLNVGVWLGREGFEKGAYGMMRGYFNELGMIKAGSGSALELALDPQPSVAGVDVSLHDKFMKYVLIDVKKPESTIVAITAAHVFNALIVDESYRAQFDAKGFTMAYDARNKTTVNAWLEFKSKCSDAALVLAPVQFGELCEMAITNRLFTVNINKVYNVRDMGNMMLFQEVLRWLAPNAPVYGWDHNVDEYKVPEAASPLAAQMVPADWCQNTTLTSMQYPNHWNFPKAHCIDPRTIDYTLNKKFVSFYLSDGDNLQWMMGDFKVFYDHSASDDVHMTYGISLGNTAMAAPVMLRYLFANQKPNVSLLERASYYFTDTYGNLKNRAVQMQRMAQMHATQMKRQGVRLMSLVSIGDSDSPAVHEWCEAVIKANDELEGIVLAPYYPYADAQGRTWWFTNSKGWDIPVVCTKYCVWSNASDQSRDGTPYNIAQKLNGGTGKFSSVLVHAWSKFRDAGDNPGLTGENMPTGSGWEEGLGYEFSAGSASLAKRHLSNMGDNVRLVNLEELFWRMRMEHNPTQTQQILDAM
ncbi:hypothetical protein FACS1894159_00600 [Bacteroidia bacterium]|nr:hypothetical protein FACS1894159_00600 [Bacteroidia bacterium]